MIIHGSGAPSQPYPTPNLQPASAFTEQLGKCTLLISAGALAQYDDPAIPDPGDPSTTPSSEPAPQESQAPPADPAPAEDPPALEEELPQTASSLPWVVIAGTTAIAGGLGLGLLRRRAKTA
jgi:LPXTG-motif cell wall-anchored protein